MAHPTSLVLVLLELPAGPWCLRSGETLHVRNPHLFPRGQRFALQILHNHVKYCQIMYSDLFGCIPHLHNHIMSSLGFAFILVTHTFLIMRDEHYQPNEHLLPSAHQVSRTHPNLTAKGSWLECGNVVSYTLSSLSGPLPIQNGNVLSAPVPDTKGMQQDAMISILALSLYSKQPQVAMQTHSPLKSGRELPRKKSEITSTIDLVLVLGFALGCPYILREANLRQDQMNFRNMTHSHSCT